MLELVPPQQPYSILFRLLHLFHHLLITPKSLLVFLSIHHRLIPLSKPSTHHQSISSDRELALQAQIDELKQIHINSNKSYVPPPRRRSQSIDGWSQQGDLDIANSPPFQPSQPDYQQIFKDFQAASHSKLNLLEFNDEFNGDVIIDWLLQFDLSSITSNSGIQREYCSQKPNSEKVPCTSGEAYNCLGKDQVF